MAKAVIMAGGQGERFWPLTHKDFPKYRIRFGGKKSLLALTYERLSKIYKKDGIYIVTTEPHEKMIRQELPFLKRSQIIIEPFRNNTCSAIYLSCATLAKKFGDTEVVSFFPADQLIQNEAAFKRTMKGAIDLAKKEPCLVTVGIKPSFPATGYGYIQKGDPVPGCADASKVLRFVEKPDLRKAVQYLKQNKFLWNAGIFTWKITTFMNAMKRSNPGFVQHFDIDHLAATYKKSPSLSIDYALMEKARNIAVYSTTMDWCDMGSWDMLFEKSLRDSKNNYAEGFYFHQEVNNSLVVNQTATPIIVLGLSDIIAVQTPRGTLICPKGRSEEAALLFKKI